MTDRTQLDAAITEARDDLDRGITHTREFVPMLDHFAALVALRARLAEIERLPCPAAHGDICGRQDELDAEAARLLGDDA